MNISGNDGGLMPYTRYLPPIDVQPRRAKKCLYMCHECSEINVHVTDFLFFLILMFRI